jgi:hypothetical protein
MRRAIIGLAVISVLAGCQDMQQPTEPGRMQASTASTEPLDGRVWILGVAQYTLADGTECVFAEENGDVGIKCGDGALQPFEGFESNPDLYPVVEICRVAAPGGDCLDRRESFIRPLVRNRKAENGEIRMLGGTDEGKYQLKLHDYFGGSANAGTYRIIIGITFTDWNTASDKVLAHFEVSTNPQGEGVNQVLQFRIARGALCENPESCVETSIEPEVETTLIFDEQYEPATNTGILGLQFPPLPETLTEQDRINIIIERIRLAPGKKCIDVDVSGLTSGSEVEPCYRVRTEPYIDLRNVVVDGKPIDPIKFGVCVAPRFDASSGLQMLKLSEVTNELTEMDATFEGGFFNCPDEYDPESTALAPASTPLSQFAARAGGMFGSVAALFTPQPAFASRSFSKSPLNGSLMDFSYITLYEPVDGYTAHYLEPVGSADPTGLTLVVPTAAVTVTACRLPDGDCSNVGTARWQDGSYHLNWNVPRDGAGEYRLTVHVNGAPAGNPVNFEVRSGRTVPLKFFLTQ